MVEYINEDQILNIEDEFIVDELPEEQGGCGCGCRGGCNGKASYWFRDLIIVLILAFSIYGFVKAIS